jgi:exodeoxyribonuclease VII large subunit
VAYAIYESQIPVISAVGHEPDVTISDFVADLRAATPSNAAELAVPDQDALLQTLDAMSDAMITAVSRQVKAASQHLRVLAASPALKSPEGYLEKRQKDLSLLQNRLVSAQQGSVDKKKQSFVGLTAKLEAMSPLKVLTRGYAMAQMEDGRTLRSVRDVNKDDKIRVRVADGSVYAQVTGRKENDNV